MKVIQFGLRYSPNLGDGIIAECLAHAIRARVSGAEVVTIDISGRSAFGDVTLRNRALAIRVLQRLPRPQRRALVRWRLGRMLDRVEPAWHAAAEGADMAMLGGGQIFSDADLNFCLKVARAAQVVAAHRLPLAIHAVGVSLNWSRRGRALFNGVFATDLRQVGVRDAGARRAWIDQAAAREPAPRITRDPGLLAAECYGPAPERNGRVGLCVTAPEILRYHADTAVAGAGVAGLGFFAALAQALCGAGHAVTLFSNGAAEDRAAVARLAGAPALAPLVATGRLAVAPAPERPEALAHLIGSFRGVVAHRLHACIVAYAYGVPVVGLGWDAKVRSFFEAIGARHLFAGSAGVGGAEVAGLLDTALAEGIDAAARQRVVSEAREAVDAALAACS